MKLVSDGTRMRCDINFIPHYLESYSTSVRQNLLGARQSIFRKTTHPVLPCITFPLTLPTTFTLSTSNPRSLFLCITLT